MNMKTTLLAMAGALVVVPAVQAQGTSPQGSAPATTPPAASSTSYSQQDIQKFAKAAVEITKIQSDTTVADAEKQPKMAAAVQAQGLDPQKFNEIARAAQADPGLQQQIQAAVTAQSK